MLVRQRALRALSVVGAGALCAAGLQVLAPAASADVPGVVSGAVYTTDVDGAIVNQNQYAQKEDVYLSGGPSTLNAHFLAEGDYFFAILDPGGQNDPNDGGDGNLSDAHDDAADRTFHADGAGHADPIATSTHSFSLARLVQAFAYDDTSNPGGVYIAAVCQYVPTSDTDPTAQAVDPRDCKYDAFKVKQGDPYVPESPRATKTAVATHVRTVDWTVTKLVDGAASQTYLGSPRTVSYTVTATKTLVKDEYGVTGSITVQNTNPDPMTVTVAENGLAPAAGVCTLVGSGSLVLPGAGSASVDYTCTFATAPVSATDYTNTATVTYRNGTGDATLTVASDPFQFPAATLTAGSEPESVDVVDTFNGGAPTALATGQADSGSWTYTRTLSNSDCVTYPNTAALTGTADAASASVTLCGPNSGGHTMGWWQNKNGQALLKGNTAAACSTLNGYLPAVFTPGATTYLPDAYTDSTKFKPYVAADCATTGTTSYLPSFVANALSVAQASGTGTKMVEGQWLTTALDTATYASYSSAGRPTLKASTKVVVPVALQGGLGLASCDTVGNLLTSSAAQYPGYATSKTAVTSALIPLLTAINENKAQTCP